MVVTVAGCSGGGGGSEASPLTTASVNTNPFLPISSGIAWQFQGFGSPAEAEAPLDASGVTVDVLRYPTGGKEYYVTTEDSIFLRGFYSPQVTVSGLGRFTADILFNESIPLWIPDDTPGTERSIRARGTVDITPTYGRNSITVEGTTRYEGLVQVSLPIGPIFAHRVVYDLTVSTVISGSRITVPFRVQVYFAEGIGIVYRVEGFGSLRLESVIDGDRDLDGVVDAVDHYPDDPTRSRDLDRDGIADEDDLDDDGDGTPDTLDVFPTNPREQSDSDGDRVGDNADTDDDNDGTSDLLDAFPFDPTESQDTDGDGTGNNADLDDDDDGIPDVDDLFPLAVSTPEDTDGDGEPDSIDPDDDDDGVLDGDDDFPLDPRYSRGLSVTRDLLEFTVGAGRGGLSSSQSFGLSAPSLAWEATAEPWIDLSHTSGSTGRSISVRVLTATLAPGAHEGTITITSTDTGATTTVRVVVDAMLPGFVVSDGTIEFDGLNGWNLSRRTLRAELLTNDQPHPFRVEIDEAVEEWLAVDAPSEISSDEIVVALDLASTELISPGRTEAEIRLISTVLGTEIVEARSLVFHGPTRRLLVPERAVSMTDMPGMQKLTERVRVYDSEDQVGVAWRAEAQVPWLTVTPSGVTGDEIEIVAEPTSLPGFGLTEGTIRVWSPDGPATNEVTIRVGVFRRQSPPGIKTALQRSWREVELATDPLRPHVYQPDELTGLVDVINLHTNQELTPINADFGRPTEAKVSPDGKYLVVTARPAGSAALDPDIVVYDLDTNEVVARWLYDIIGNDPVRFELFEIKGKLMMLSEQHEVRDVMTGHNYTVGGTRLDSGGSRVPYSISDDGKLACHPSSFLNQPRLRCWTLNYWIDTDRFSADSVLYYASTLTGVSVDSVISEDKSTVFMAGSTEGVIEVWVDTGQLRRHRVLGPNPRSIERGPDGSIHALASPADFETDDLFVFGPDAAAVSFSANARMPADAQAGVPIAVSGDGRVTIVRTSDDRLVFVRNY